VNLLPLVFLVVCRSERHLRIWRCWGAALFACVQATVLQRDVVNGFVGDRRQPQPAGGLDSSDLEGDGERVLQ